MNTRKTLMTMAMFLLLFAGLPALAAFSTDKIVGAAVSEATGQALNATGTPVTPASPAIPGRINVNAADAATLASLPGIGPKKAAAIVAHRQANGNFKSADDLAGVKGIGPGILGKIKDLIAF